MLAYSVFFLIKIHNEQTKSKTYHDKINLQSQDESCLEFRLSFKKMFHKVDTFTKLSP